MPADTPANAPIEAAFVELRHRLRAYLRRRLPDAAPVDDVLQDIFVKALAAEASGKPIGNLTGWLYASARNAVCDYYRARHVETTDLDDDMPQTEAYEDIELHSALAECLRPFIARLPELYRDTLIATELDGKTLRAVAEAQGLSVSAIKSRAARGRALLKAMLLDCCHVEMAGGLVSDYHRRQTTGCGGACQ